MLWSVLCRQSRCKFVLFPRLLFLIDFRITLQRSSTHLRTSNRLWTAHLADRWRWRYQWWSWRCWWFVIRWWFVQRFWTLSRHTKTWSWAIRWRGRFTFTTCNRTINCSSSRQEWSSEKGTSVVWRNLLWAEILVEFFAIFLPACATREAMICGMPMLSVVWHLTLIHTDRFTTIIAIFSKHCIEAT